MTDAILLPVCLDRVANANGVPISGARIFIYDAGTTNLKDVYTDRTLVTAAANPIVADGAGWVPARYIGLGAYKVVIKDPLGSSDPGDWSTLHTEDELPGPVDTTPFESEGATPVMPVIAVATSTYTVLEADLGSVFKCDPSGGEITITLPDPATTADGSLVTVVRDGATNDVVVEDTGGTLYTLDDDGEAVTFVCDGTEWTIISVVKADESPTITAFMLTVLDDANAAAARATLGLTIGTHVQAQDATLQAVADASTASNKLLYWSGVDVASMADFTAFARTLLDDADAAAAQTTLGISTFVKTLLDDANAAAFLTTLGVSAYAQTVLDDADASTALSTLGFSAFAKTLIDDTTAGAFLTTLGISAYIQTLLDDAAAGNARTTLGLGTLATLSTVNDGNWSGTDLSIPNGGTGGSSASAARDNLDVTQIPSTSALPIGGARMMFVNSGSTVLNGSTVAGTSLTYAVIGASGVNLSGGGASGTWRNISGQTLDGTSGPGFGGLFVRTA